MQLMLQGRLLACLAGVRPCGPQSDLLAVGILEDQQVQDQVAGNLQDLEVMDQGRVFPCLPLAALPLTGLPLVALP